MVVQLFCIKAQMTDGNKPSSFFLIFNFLVAWSSEQHASIRDTSQDEQGSVNEILFWEQRVQVSKEKKEIGIFRLINPFVCLQQWMNNTGWNMMNVFSTPQSNVFLWSSNNRW